MRLQTVYRGVVGALMLALWVVGSGVAATHRTLVAPTISDFTPKTGAPGTQVVITGTGFTGAKVTFFGELGVAAAAVVVNAAGTSITATVPAPPEESPTPVPSPIFVATPGGTVSSTANFVFVASSAAKPTTTTAATAQPAAPHVTVWTAALSSGQEVPKQVVKNAPAHGLFKGTLSGNTLKWTLTYSKLTGPATAAHIHMAAKGISGPVVVPLCPPCKSGQSSKATLTPALLSAFKKHLLYVNVHTTKNPNGEIRGQLAAG